MYFWKVTKQNKKHFFCGPLLFLTALPLSSRREGVLASSNPPKEARGGIRFTQAVSAVVPPASLGLGLGMSRRSSRFS